MPVCHDLSGQVERPIVRLLNAFDQVRTEAENLIVSFGIHNFSVVSWHFEDTVSFGVKPEDPDVYLFRELALELSMDGYSVVLWLCDELNMDEPPACICPIYGDEWSSAQAAKLGLLFGGRVQEGEMCPFLKVAISEITLWLNGQPVKAD